MGYRRRGPNISVNLYYYSEFQYLNRVFSLYARLFVPFALAQGKHIQKDMFHEAFIYASHVLSYGVTHHYENLTPSGFMQALQQQTKQSSSLSPNGVREKKTLTLEQSFFQLVQVDSFILAVRLLIMSLLSFFWLGALSKKKENF